MLISDRLRSPPWVLAIATRLTKPTQVAALRAELRDVIRRDVTGWVCGLQLLHAIPLHMSTREGELDATRAPSLAVDAVLCGAAPLVRRPRPDVIAVVGRPVAEVDCGCW